jgi:hypothetical protein
MTSSDTDEMKVCGHTAGLVTFPKAIEGNAEQNSRETNFLVFISITELKRSFVLSKMTTCV